MKQFHYCTYVAAAFVALLATGPVSAHNSVAKPTTDNVSVAKYTLRGRIIDAKSRQPLQYAQIGVMDTSLGGVTDANGYFVINGVPRNKVTIRVKFIGYNTRDFIVDASSSASLTLELVPSAFNVDEVVVSANRTETRRREAPVLVNVTGERLFNATSSINLDQALKFNPGVRVEDNCQNCGFNQVRINGLDGSYSQIIINSRSIFSALAGVYALEMLPTEMIDRVEVVRGGGSALFGSSAIGGTVNIITKAPTRNMASGSYTTEMYQDNFGVDKMEHNFNGYVSVVSPDHKAGISIFGRMKQRPGVDVVRPNSKIKADDKLGTKDGQDGFTDIPRLFSSNVGMSSFLNLSPESKLSLDYFYTQEERRGGNNLDRPEHEADIAESLRHRMHTGILRLDQYLFDGHGYLTAFIGGSSTVRNSYYGGGPVTEADLQKGYSKPMPEPVEQNEGESDADFKLREDAYKAKQDAWEKENGHLTNKDLSDYAKAIGAYGYTKQSIWQYGLQYVHNFDKLLFMPAELTAGLEHEYNKLNDNSGYRPEDIDQKINTTSAYLQNEWKNEMFSLLLGGRFDRVNLDSQDKFSKDALHHLNIFTPRAIFRFNPFEDLNLRLSYAKGFRAPAYFDEDLHVAFANGEGKPHVLDPNLKEERSNNITGSVDYYLDLNNGWNLNLMVEGFYTALDDKFATVTGTTSDGQTVEFVRNADEATVVGVNAEARIAYQNLVALQCGFTAQKSTFKNEQEVIDESGIMSKDFMRTPNNYGYFVLSYTPTHDFALNLSGNYTGTMKVPHEVGEKTGDYITIQKPVLEDSPSFFTLNTKASYTFDVNNTHIQLNCGINNIFNSYQKDFDEGPARASAYIYGPKTPRSIFAGIKFSL